MPRKRVVPGNSRGTTATPAYSTAIDPFQDPNIQEIPPRSDEPPSARIRIDDQGWEGHVALFLEEWHECFTLYHQCYSGVETILQWCTRAPPTSRTIAQGDLVGSGLMIDAWKKI